MKPVFSFSGIREVEKKIIQEDGVPSLILMENAGKNAFDILCLNYPDIEEYSIFIICGKGNNAGDGFVIARQLALNRIKSVVINISNTNELSGDALANFELLGKITSGNVSVFGFNEFVNNFTSHLKNGKILIIDAILGNGVKGGLNTIYSEAVDFINKVKAANKKLKIASIDVPSGLMSGKQINPIIKADVTITMGAIKSEMLFGEGKENCGDIFVAPIGIPDSSLENCGGIIGKIAGFEDIQWLFPKRRKSSYKYSNGKALLIGGSKGMSGALIMSSLAAIKSGCGGVVAAFPESLSAHFGKNLYDVVKLELSETPEGSISANAFDEIKKRLSWANALLLGPGISLNNETKNFVFEAVRKSDKNIVIDADALTLLSEDISLISGRENDNEIILTPHIGEFSKLSGLTAEEIINNRFETVSEFAVKYNVNIVLKSETTICCTSKGEIYINSSGNETLATVGSGDVLSGILVSMLAQTGNVKSSMISGVYLHGMLADIYYERSGNKQTAAQRDLIKLLPEAVTRIIS